MKIILVMRSVKNVKSVPVVLIIQISISNVNFVEYAVSQKSVILITGKKFVEKYQNVKIVSFLK